jgi:hypothetical protein
MRITQLDMVEDEFEIEMGVEWVEKNENKQLKKRYIMGRVGFKKVAWV